MAELFIVVVAVVVVLLYAADRARKLRVRARQMAGMNERLDAAAAKIDKEQQRKRARVRASAELTSVMPANTRPPLTLPGRPGPGDAAENEAPPEAVPEAAPEAVPEAAPEAVPEAAGHAEEGPAAEETDDAIQAAPAARAVAEADPAPVPADGAGRAAAKPARPAESTLSMPASGAADGLPGPKTRVTSEGTLIMPSVPAQGPVPAGRGPAGTGHDEGRLRLAPDTMRGAPAAYEERTDRR